VTKFLLEGLFITQSKLNGQKEEPSESSSRVITFLLLHPLNQMPLSNANAYCKCLYGDVLSEEGQNEILV